LQFFLPLFNVIFLHPTMMLVLCRTKNTMSRPIFLGYVLTETIWAFGALINIPFFFMLLVHMHQAVIREVNKLFKVYFSRKQSIISGFITGIFVINIIGFNFLARDCDDAPRLVKQPELQWLLGRNGNVFIFGDFGNPQYF
ncbi:hypothetical protein PFISCL1PPCAC_3388, partial [Pristionchus fissidentatus]